MRLMRFVDPHGGGGSGPGELVYVALSTYFNVFVRLAS